MFTHSDKVWIVKDKAKDEYLACAPSGEWYHVDNIMDCEYFKTKDKAETIAAQFSVNKDGYEVYCMLYEFYWSWVEE